MSVKDISYLELWLPLCLVEQNHLCNFGRRHHEEQFCEIILNLDQWFRRRCRLKNISYLDLWPQEFQEMLFKRFLSRALKAFLLGRVELKHLCNFSRGHYG